jgi:Ca2+:H+ antiporter
LAVIVWCAFGVVEEADHLAELLGEPLGTLILTLSIVIIEVALIAAVMLGAHAAPTLGRDTMFAVLMIILNGVVGLALLLGGLRHHEQEYNLQGAVAYLAVVLPLATIALILPNFTRTTPDPALSTVQGSFFALFTLLLYGVFLAVQTVRHRSFFVEPQQAAAAAETHGREQPAAGVLVRHTGLLIVTMLPIVLLAKQLAKLIDYGIAVLGAPVALGGVLIALIVFTPEGMSALRAALDNQLQRSVNLCLGAACRPSG